MNDYVFALDIGTQSVTGLILEKKEDTYAVVDYCIEEHKKRSMLDGQIHNVLAVSEVIIKVKDKLEESHGPLHKVAVAAAGRALKTIQAKYERDISAQPIKDKDELKHLELSAVQQAQKTLVDSNNEEVYTNYHCVGYSVLHYMLDGDKIGSPIDQTGTRVEVDVIATFLPKIVIDSLSAALERANLKMDALTLEPIAAINVLIPDSMRRLNVALVDIGAGTSDIALTNDGTVTAYGMVPVAGDKITETMSDEYLLDFKVAEEAKRRVVNEGQTTILDILGFDATITYADLITKIDKAVKQLAHLITEEILTLNGTSPKAVMLIGGGSLTPLLKEKVAESLQLPHNRVAIRDIEAIQQLEKSNLLPDGPDFVTPIGIAITAEQSPIHYINITVNDNPVRMFELNNLTVGDCIVQSAIDLDQYYGRPGLAAIITLNGKKMTLRGEYGTKPLLYVNNQRADIHTSVDNGDYITIERGHNGTTPNVTIEELIGYTEPMTLYLNDEKHVIRQSIKVNDREVTEDYRVQDNDVIQTYMPDTIGDFLKKYSLRDYSEPKPFYVYVNEKQMLLSNSQTKLFVNGKPSSVNQRIKDGDRITTEHKDAVTVRDLLTKLDLTLYETIDVIFNGSLITLKQERTQLFKNEELLKESDPLNHLDKITILEKEIEPFIFQDVFRYVDIERHNHHRSQRYELLKNDEQATFHDPIQAGDLLKFVWLDD